jgi:glycosyltransferase involved in cell wall biosynthesis
LKVLYTVADLQPENGGPSRSVSALASAVARLGVDTELVVLEYGSGSTAPMVPSQAVRTTLVPCRGWLAQKFKRSPAFASALQKCCTGGGGNVLLHDNGLWLPTNHMAAGIARKMRIPLVISPRGMLTPWALKFRGFKKRIAWSLYQRRDLQVAAVLHATSRQEAEEFRALGLTQPVAVIPNGVELPPEIRKSAIGNRKSETKTVLFLSRIHPKKGLLDLASAWAHVKESEIGNRKSEIGSWRVVVAGGDENGHLEQVRAETRKLKLENDFEFVGEVADDKKWELYRSADLFVLPTKSENFGIVIAEALASSVPVITTRGTPWEDLTTCQCGWWVDIGVKPLADAMREAVNLSDQERREMGARGRELITGKYSWPAIAARMTSVYEWMLGKASKPGCLQI